VLIFDVIVTVLAALLITVAVQEFPPRLQETISFGCIPTVIVNIELIATFGEYMYLSNVAVIEISRMDIFMGVVCNVPK
jgi:hypothetical protein